MGARRWVSAVWITVVALIVVVMVQPSVDDASSAATSPHAAHATESTEISGNDVIEVAPRTILPGDTAVVTIRDGAFESGEHVTVFVTQPPRTPPAVVEAPDRADSGGGLIVVFTAPKGSVGDYVLRFAASREYSTTIRVRSGVELPGSVLVTAPHAAPLSGGAVAAFSLWIALAALGTVTGALVLRALVAARPEGALGRLTLRVKASAGAVFAGRSRGRNRRPGSPDRHRRPPD